jgi:hypothetical protein
MMSFASVSLHVIVFPRARYPDVIYHRAQASAAAALATAAENGDLHSARKALAESKQLVKDLKLRVIAHAEKKVAAAMAVQQAQQTVAQAKNQAKHANAKLAAAKTEERSKRAEHKLHPTNQAKHDAAKAATFKVMAATAKSEKAHDKLSAAKTELVHAKEHQADVVAKHHTLVAKAKAAQKAIVQIKIQQAKNQAKHAYGTSAAPKKAAAQQHKQAAKAATKVKAAQANAQLLRHKTQAALSEKVADEKQEMTRAKKVAAAAAKVNF